MKEQISEEFADKLLEGYYFGDKPDFRACVKEMKKRWKENGYIKQPREEEIRERIDNLYQVYGKKFAKDFPKDIEEYIITMTNIKNTQKELIEILDNKRGCRC
jgi:hypothetical protein